MYRPHCALTRARLIVRFAMAVYVSLACCLCPTTAPASGIPLQTGDVLAAVGEGRINHFSPDGALLDTLNFGGGIYDTGMGFDAAGNLYVTAFDLNNVYKFDSKGVLLGSFGSGYNADPESIVFDNAGNAYVGQADGFGTILKFNSVGTLVDTYSPQREDRGTDWIDLAADQCTMHYTSEGSEIKRYNVCTRTQRSDYATGLPGGICYAHRIRPNAEELVACSSVVNRIDSSGALIQSYQVPGASLLFALNLDPDGRTFWTADYYTGSVYRLNIADGSIIKQFNAHVLSVLAGLAVAGELTAVTSAPLPTTSYYVTSARSSIFRNLGRDLATSQLATGAAQDSSIALLFRAPTYKNGEYGVAIAGTFTSLSTITALAEAFASGYYNALGNNKTDHARIIVTTSNGTTMCGGNQVTYGHGRAWAQMINTIATWIVAQGYSGQVDVAGGSDMELDSATWPPTAPCGAGGNLVWAGPADTRQWVDGYASVFPRRYLYNLGDAAGCRQSGTTATPARCNANWTQEDVWYVSWGADPSVPLPEIYQNPSAPQWQQVSLYSYLNSQRRNGGAMVFSGALTEFQACYPNPNVLTSPDPTCNPAFTPQHGWQKLHDTLNADNRTAQQTLPWSTDVKWASP
jgi:hypothetical protein